MNSFKTPLIILLSLLILSVQSLADVVCVYANGDQSDRISGHAFITLERNGRILDTYGYYPEVVPSLSGVAFIRTYNQVLSDQRLYELHGEGAIQEKFCNSAQGSILSRLDNRYDLQWYVEKYALDYLEKHPRYGAFGRNCFTFAKQAYMDLTGDVIPRGKTTPVGLALFIRKAHSEGVSRLEDL